MDTNRIIAVAACLAAVALLASCSVSMTRLPDGTLSLSGAALQAAAVRDESK